MKHHKAVEDSISQRERDLADFVENAVVSLHWVGEDGTILWANQAELDLLGYTREEYIGHSITEFHVDQGVIEDILKRLAAGEKLNNYEARLRCKDGSVKQVLISSSVRFEEEEFVHTRCFTLDITERKQAESRTVLLQQLTSALSEAITLNEVLTVIIEEVIIKSGASAGSIMLLNQAGTQLELLRAAGYTEQELKPWQSFPVTSANPLTESVRSQQPIYLNGREAFQSRFPAVSDLQAMHYTAWAVLPLVAENRIMGVLGLSFVSPQRFNDTDALFLIALAQQCAQALERARLSEQAQLRAVEVDRQQLARDLHDSVSQTLFTINTLSQTGRKAMDKNPEQAREQFEQVTRLTQKAMAEMRTLLLELRPTAIVKTPLKDLVNQLIEAAQTGSSLTLTAQVEVEYILPELVLLALYRIMQEGLNNIIKHSQATAAGISLRVVDHQIHLRIWDNGQGFAPDAASAGMGLGSMRERAEAIQATFEIVSKLHHGTEILVKWTLPKEGT